MKQKRVIGQLSSMTKVAILILFLILSSKNCIAQGQGKYQNHPNSLFPIGKFLNFIGSVEDGEERLLAWDFGFIGKSKSGDGEIEYYDYKLNHTFSYQTNLYAFDRFSITNDKTSFLYLTSSNKNFLAYKRKLIAHSFEKVTDDYYKKNHNGKEYRMILDRKMFGNTPNYWIIMTYE